MRDGLSSAGGSVLAAGTRAIAWLRPAAKPLHPDGVTLEGHLVRRGAPADGPRSGVAWLDEPGRDEVLVRLSRSVGLPQPFPDVHGLAMRVLLDEGPGDVLLASTGWSRIGRFAMIPGRHPWSRPLTTLLPYRTAQGAVVLGARASESGDHELFWAAYDGPWQPFADLVLSDRETTEHVDFDPVRRQLPGLEQYPVVVRLREPAYRTARRSRRP